MQKRFEQIYLVGNIFIIVVSPSFKRELRGVFVCHFVIVLDSGSAGEGRWKLVRNRCDSDFYVNRKHVGFLDFEI